MLISSPAPLHPRFAVRARACRLGRSSGGGDDVLRGASASSPVLRDRRACNGETDRFRGPDSKQAEGKKCNLFFDCDNHVDSTFWNILHEKIMEVDGMAPWMTIFLYKQVASHFHDFSGSVVETVHQSKDEVRMIGAMFLYFPVPYIPY